MFKARVLSAAAVILLAAGPAWAAASQKSTMEDQTSVEVTVYNSNIALVKDRRTLDLVRGEGELLFMDVASSIIPETVYISSLNQPEQWRVLEQNYEYDLMNSNKIMDKYVGKNVKLLNRYFDEGAGDVKEEITGARLLSNNNGDQIFEIDGEIHLGHPGFRILPEIPEDLIAKPTLAWLYQNTAARAHEIEASYLTNNINWKADYVVVLNRADDEAGINGWVTLDNRSGTAYRDAKLKLIAGDVNRVQRGQGARYEKRVMASMMDMEMAAPQFEEKSFFEYHIYDLQRPATIKNNQKKQISLLEADRVAVEKKFVIKGAQNYYWSNHMNSDLRDPVQVMIRFKNEKDNNLGIPLPAGVMRLYKEDDSGSLQFIGEDRIEHTPKDEWVKLKIGEAFDVTSRRRQMSFRNISRMVTESEWEVEIHNHKDADIVVEVVETLNGDWTILSASHQYEKDDAFHVRFRVPVQKDQKVTLKYKVRFDRG